MARYSPATIETARFLLENPWSTRRQVTEHLLSMIEVPDRKEYYRHHDRDFTWKAVAVLGRQELVKLLNTTSEPRPFKLEFTVTHQGQVYQVHFYKDRLNSNLYTGGPTIYRVHKYDGTNYSQFRQYFKTLDLRHSRHVQGGHLLKGRGQMAFIHDGGFPRKWYITEVGLALACARPMSPTSKSAHPYKDRSKHLVDVQSPF